MSNAFVNFLKAVADGSGDFRDYQHASRLYVDNTYELAPKPGWIYYVVLNVSPFLSFVIQDAQLRDEFNFWYDRYKGVVGLLAKMVDQPKFSIETEIMNQYNRKVVVQKKINYSTLGITFHDDMANVVTNLWKAYYTYYFADSIDVLRQGSLSIKTGKYQDNKYDPFVEELSFKYGLNNDQSIPFFSSIDVYQLYQKRFTKFKIVNPIIKEWSHDPLDQSVGNKMLGARMSIDYETIIYDTSPTNYVTEDNPGFNNSHYDRQPSPLTIGGRGTTSILGPGGLVAGARDIFGTLTNPGAGPLDFINAALQANNWVRNARNVSKEGLKEEGVSVFNSVLSGINSNGEIVSGGLNGLNQALNPAGIRIPLGTDPTIGQTAANPVNLPGPGG